MKTFAKTGKVSITLTRITYFLELFVLSAELAAQDLVALGRLLIMWLPGLQPCGHSEREKVAKFKARQQIPGEKVAIHRVGRGGLIT